MQTQHPAKTVVIQNVDILKVICGKQSMLELRDKYFPQVRLLLCFQLDAQLEQLIQQQRQFYLRSCREIIIAYLKENDKQLISAEEKNETIAMMLTAGRYSFQKENDPLLAEFLQRSLLDNFSFFNMVVKKLTTSNLDGCLLQIRTARQREFSSEERQCIEQQKKAHFDAGFHQWIQEQYRLASLISHSTSEAFQAADEVVPQVTHHKLFDDSATKKSAALNKNQQHVECAHERQRRSNRS